MKINKFMTKEEKFVVDPLEGYFLDTKRSGAKWKTKDKPKFGSAATGWDLQMERKNQVLLIEAKYIMGPAVSAVAGLVIAPLSNRPEKMNSGKKKSWSSVICWAIGCGYEKNNRNKKYKMSGFYQILFDYFARNLKFLRSYSKTLKVKYIYFTNKSLHERRLVAEGLLKNLKFK